MLMFILTIIGIIVTWQFYKWACGMATRSVTSTEQTGELMQALIDALPPEAQARAAEAAAKRRTVHLDKMEAMLSAQRKRRGVAVAVVGFIVLFLFFLSLIGSGSTTSNSSSRTDNARYETLCGPNGVSWSVDASGREVYSCDGKTWWRK